MSELPPSPSITPKEFWAALRARHPPVRLALREDARVTAIHRGERHVFRSRTDTAIQIIRLCAVSDAFLAQVLYREVKARLQDPAGSRLLPLIAHRLAMALAQVSIGDPVVIEPGVYIVHGQVVLDGLVEIHSGVVISPFVTIGLRSRANVRGPTVGPGVSIGTGAKLIGPVSGSAPARQSAPTRSSSVTSPPGATVVGAPARPIPARLRRDDARSDGPDGDGYAPRSTSRGVSRQCGTGKRCRSC